MRTLIYVLEYSQVYTCIECETPLGETAKRAAGLELTIHKRRAKTFFNAL